MHNQSAQAEQRMFSFNNRTPVQEKLSVGVRNVGVKNTMDSTTHNINSSTHKDRFMKPVSDTNMVLRSESDNNGCASSSSNTVCIQRNVVNVINKLRVNNASSCNEQSSSSVAPVSAATSDVQKGPRHSPENNQQNNTLRSKWKFKSPQSRVSSGSNSPNILASQTTNEQQTTSITNRTTGTNSLHNTETTIQGRKSFQFTPRVPPSTTTTTAATTVPLPRTCQLSINQDDFTQKTMSPIETSQWVFKAKKCSTTSTNSKVNMSADGNHTSNEDPLWGDGEWNQWLFIEQDFYL